jgi:hypothetical protein
MTELVVYQRVLPRDLFNESKLLKCLGQLALLLHDGYYPDLSIDYDGGAFEILQDNSDGSLICTNFSLCCGEKSFYLYVPYNDKSAYPLLLGWNDSVHKVLDEIGIFHHDFLDAIEYIKGASTEE